MQKRSQKAEFKRSLCRPDFRRETMYVKSPTIYDGITEKPKVPLGYILYVIFLPVIGLFLERYAYSAVVAIILWALIVILMPLCCALDKKMLEKHDVNTVTLGKSFLFPPVYIYKRQVRVGGESMLCVACITLCIGALLTNGFIKGMRVNTDNVGSIVQNSSISQLNNFSGSSKTTIGSCVDAYSEKEVKWDVTKQSYGFDIKAEGTHDSESFVISFKLEFDGFAYHDFLIYEVTVGGKTLDKEGRKKFLTKCFIEYKAFSSDNSKADSSQGQDSKDSDRT